MFPFSTIIKAYGIKLIVIITHDIDDYFYHSFNVKSH